MRHVMSFVVSLIGMGLLQAALAQQPDPSGTAAKSPVENKKPSDPKAPPRPGKDRWLVKTASDTEAQAINPVPQKTTIEALLKLPRPATLPLKETPPAMQAHRAYPVEASVYTVEADIIACQAMPDGDYKVTLRGASGQTLVMEMPDPAPGFVDPASPFAKQIAEARTQFDGKFQPERTARPILGHARLTGIGYFGRAYGSQEPTGNLIQLHPVLKVEWLPRPTPEFSTPETKPAKSPTSPVKKTSGKAAHARK